MGLIMFLTAQETQVLGKFCRQMVYFGLTIVAILFLYFLADYYHEETFREFGVVENIQLGLLSLSAILFAGEAVCLKKHSAVLWFLASLCALGACRELDSFFDTNLPIISWKFGFLFPIAATINLYRQRKAARNSLFYFLETPAFNLMFTAVLIGLALAQVLGHRKFIAAVLGEEVNARAVRRILEEGTEVIAYFLILLSTVECYFSFKKK